MGRRNYQPDLASAAEHVDKIMRLGYNITEFSPYHVRVYAGPKHALDYWPTSGRWRDPKGYRGENAGLGIKSLKDYLIANHPLPVADPPQLAAPMAEAAE